MKERITAPWGAARALRLAMAGVFLWAGVAEGNAVAWAMAGILGAQAVLNIGCCGASACAAPPTGRNTAKGAPEVNYEEVR